MITLALLLRRKALEKQDVECILHALVRLEIYRMEQQSESVHLQPYHVIGKEFQTVVFALPGQTCIKPLLSMLVQLFPCDDERHRHVFAYDHCVDSVHRAMNMDTNMNRTMQKKHSNGSVSHTSMPVTAMPRMLTASLPIVPMQKDLPSFLMPLANLSSPILAGIVETWLSSVDTFLALKNGNGKDQDQGNDYVYTPFVCRMEYLMGITRTETDEDMATKQKNGKDNVHANPTTTLNDKSRMALIHVLQYITGSCTSQPLQESTIDAAQSVLVDVIQNEHERKASNRDEEAKGLLVRLLPMIMRKKNANRHIISEEDRLAIEACVNVQKQILTGDAILPDTVEPKMD